MEDALKVQLSCLVDCDPKFVMQAYNWAIALRASGTTATLYICSIDGALSASQKRTFERLGCRVVKAERFGDGPAAFCNKISQLFIDEVLDCDWIILSDADIGFLSPPERTIDGAPLRAKRVDLPNPSVPALENWLNAIEMPWFGDSEAQFALQQSDAAPVKSVWNWFASRFGTGEVWRKTLAHNYNGGLYVVRRDVVESLRRAWADYAQKLLAAAPRNAGWTKHADQIGFACAVYELDLQVSELDSGWNFPVHLEPEVYKSLGQGLSLFGLHYHSNLNHDGLPEAVGVSWVDGPLKTLRDTVVAGRREHFDIEILANYREKYFS